MLGLYETHIQTTDLERSGHFYEQVLGLQLASNVPGVARFYWIGEPQQYMLGVWLKKDGPVDRRHFAIRVTPDEMKKTVKWLKERGLSVRNHPNDGTDRPYVFAWMPAVSIYWDDPDGHSLEFIALLPDAPRPELGTVLWEEWEAMHGRLRPVMEA